MGTLKLALRNLVRRPARTALLGFSIALGVTMALTLLALANGIETGVKESVFERGSDLLVAQRSALDNLSGFLPVETEQKLSMIEGVSEVAGELAVFVPADFDHQLLALGWTAESFFWSEMPIREGRALVPGEEGVILGRGAAEALSKAAGDTIRIYDESFPIVGIAEYQSLINRGLIILPLASLQRLSFREGQVTVFHVRLKPAASVADGHTAREAINLIEEVIALPSEDLVARDRNYRILRAISFAISIIALTMASVGVLNALLTAVQERRREIGILMAIGWGAQRIIATIVIEGGALGVVGCLVGIPLGLVACALFNQHPGIGDFIHFVPTAGSLALCSAASVALSMIGALYPAWRAVAHSPSDLLRSL